MSRPPSSTFITPPSPMGPETTPGTLQSEPRSGKLSFWKQCWVSRSDGPWPEWHFHGLSWKALQRVAENERKWAPRNTGDPVLPPPACDYSHSLLVPQQYFKSLFDIFHENLCSKDHIWRNTHLLISYQMSQPFYILFFVFTETLSWSYAITNNAAMNILLPMPFIHSFQFRSRS